MHRRDPPPQQDHHHHHHHHHPIEQQHNHRNHSYHTPRHENYIFLRQPSSSSPTLPPAMSSSSSSLWSHDFAGDVTTRVHRPFSSSMMLDSSSQLLIPQQAFPEGRLRPSSWAVAPPTTTSPSQNDASAVAAEAQRASLPRGLGDLSWICCKETTSFQQQERRNYHHRRQKQALLVDDDDDDRYVKAPGLDPGHPLHVFDRKNLAKQEISRKRQASSASSSDSSSSVDALHDMLTWQDAMLYQLWQQQQPQQTAQFHQQLGHAFSLAAIAAASSSLASNSGARDEVTFKANLRRLLQGMQQTNQSRKRIRRVLLPSSLAHFSEDYQQHQEPRAPGLIQMPTTDSLLDSRRDETARSQLFSDNYRPGNQQQKQQQFPALMPARSASFGAAENEEEDRGPCVLGTCPQTGQTLRRSTCWLYAEPPAHPQPFSSSVLDPFSLSLLASSYHETCFGTWPSRTPAEASLMAQHPVAFFPQSPTLAAAATLAHDDFWHHPHHPSPHRQRPPRPPPAAAVRPEPDESPPAWGRLLLSCSCPCHPMQEQRRQVYQMLFRQAMELKVLR